MAQGEWSPEPFAGAAAAAPLSSSNPAGAAGNPLRASRSSGQVIRWSSAHRQSSGAASGSQTAAASVNTATAAATTPTAATLPHQIFEDRSAAVSQASNQVAVSAGEYQAAASNAVVWTSRSSNDNAVQPAQFAAPLPPAQAALAPPQAMPPLTMAQPVVLHSLLQEDLPPEATPPETLANPFGSREASPSDRAQPSGDNQLTPAEEVEPRADREDPRDDAEDSRRARPLDNCDEVRSELLDVPISTISLDVSPRFGTGPKEKRDLAELRQSFVADAPLRSWSDYRGQPITTARLLDLSYDAAHLRLDSGAEVAVYLRDLSDSDLAYIAESWNIPTECSITDRELAARQAIASTVVWKASGLCHKPLYFEQIQLERYGHEFGPVAQPLLSTAHFFGSVAFLPYKMGINPMSECQYALGYYRPGNCAPWMIPPVPLSLRGAAAQAATVTGAAMVLP